MSDTTLPTPPEFTFPDRLRKSRMGAGLSAAEIADRLGRKRQTVNGWERGSGEPKATELAEWCVITQCSPLWLLYGTNDVSDLLIRMDGCFIG